MAGFEVSLRDFLHLIGELSYRDAVGPFLQHDYGIRLEGERGDTRLVDAEGNDVDPAELHARTQADPRMQHELYSLAMSQWR